MTALPIGIQNFLVTAGWGDSAIAPIPGDASFRRYFRIAANGRRAMLMHAPPPHEDPAPFVHATRFLTGIGQRAPQIYAQDVESGYLLIEDFGDDRMRDWLDTNPAGEQTAYRAAVETLTQLHDKSPGPFAQYDMETYLREVALFTQWYCPAAGLKVDDDAFLAAWQNTLEPLMDRQNPGVTVLRDYHAENIMLIDPDPSGGGQQGIIDYQDALVGHPAYDLVSLLQDARREVPQTLEAEMLGYYRELAEPGADFDADYARLGAQRNTKIVGIFTRLAKRDGKSHYLDMIPRVWSALERDLAHPALAPIAAWFDANIPPNIHEAKGRRLS
ncbi:MAG: phosphotransferase [Pontixanthobacter sp.]